MAGEEEREPGRAREHDSMREYISHFLPFHKGAELVLPHERAKPLSLSALALSLRQKTRTPNNNNAAHQPIV